MRKIKFRGKRVDNGEWVYGSLQDRGNGEQWICWIVLEPGTGIPIGNHALVNPNTIGQFTGLHDKNGVEIFEGDVLQEPHGNKFCSYCNANKQHPTSVVVYNIECARFEGDRAFGASHKDLKTLVNKYGGVIIWNIHDHPELIK